MIDLQDLKAGDLLTCLEDTDIYEAAIVGNDRSGKCILLRENQNVIFASERVSNSWWCKLLFNGNFYLESKDCLRSRYKLSNESSRAKQC